VDRRRALRPPRLASDLPEEAEALLEDSGELSGVHVTGIDGEAAAPGAEIIGCRFTGVWLIGADLERVRVVDSVFEHCDLSAAQLTRATLIRTSFSDCRLVGAGISDADLTDVRFDGCRMSEVDLRMARTECLELHDCDLHDADLYAAALPGARLLGCDLSGAECSKSSWPGAWLHGSTLTGVKGAGAMREVTIASDQIVPLALGVFADLGITVTDDPES
jgi:uncharacterized protein YjbI with pentapeptide repeats